MALPWVKGLKKTSDGQEEALEAERDRGPAEAGEVLHGHGMTMADAIRRIGISEVTLSSWRKAYDRMSGDQLRRLKALEK